MSPLFIPNVLLSSFILTKSIVNVPETWKCHCLEIRDVNRRLPKSKAGPFALSCSTYRECHEGTESSVPWFRVCNLNSGARLFAAAYHPTSHEGGH